MTCDTNNLSTCRCGKWLTRAMAQRNGTPAMLQILCRASAPNNSVKHRANAGVSAIHREGAGAKWLFPSGTMANHEDASDLQFVTTEDDESAVQFRIDIAPR
jgi:hypothetical protein